MDIEENIFMLGDAQTHIEGSFFKIGHMSKIKWTDLEVSSGYTAVTNSISITD